MIKYIHPKLMKFPRSEKYGLALEIRKCLYAMLGYAVEANNMFINTKYTSDIEKSIQKISDADNTQFKEGKLFMLRTIKHYEINKNKTKRRDLQNKIDTELRKFKTFITLADELGYFGKGEAKDFSTKLNDNIQEKAAELGKILGGWIKST